MDFEIVDLLKKFFAFNLDRKYANLFTQTFAKQATTYSTGQKCTTTIKRLKTALK